MLSRGYRLSLQRYQKLNPKVVLRRHLATAYETVDLASTTFVADGATRPPVMLFPGMFIHKKYFEGLATDLRKATGRTVITVDARNHGTSPHSPQHTFMHMAHDTAKLINKLGHPKVSILGYSMGGRVAMAVSLLFPELISSTIVIDISPVNTDDRTRAKIIHFLDALSKISFRSCTSLSEARMQAADLFLQFPNQRVKDCFMNSIVLTETSTYKWCFNIPAIRNHLADMFSFPRELNGSQYFGPSMFIAGAESNYIGKKEFKEIQKFFPMARLATVEDTGHLLPFDKPEMLVQVASDFLAEN